MTYNVLYDLLEHTPLYLDIAKIVTEYKIEAPLLNHIIDVYGFNIFEPLLRIYNFKGCEINDLNCCSCNNDINKVSRSIGKMNIKGQVATFDLRYRCSQCTPEWRYRHGHIHYENIYYKGKLNLNIYIDETLQQFSLIDPDVIAMHTIMRNIPRVRSEVYCKVKVTYLENELSIDLRFVKDL
jgi:hypothetical protein